MLSRTKLAVINEVQKKFHIKDKGRAVPYDPLPSLKKSDLRLQTSVCVSQDHEELTSYARSKGFKDFSCPEFMPQGKWAAVVRHKLIARCQEGVPLDSQLTIRSGPVRPVRPVHFQTVVDEVELAPRLRLGGQALTCVGIFVLCDLVYTDKYIYLNATPEGSNAAKNSEVPAASEETKVADCCLCYDNELIIAIKGLRMGSTKQSLTIV